MAMAITVKTGNEYSMLTFCSKTSVLKSCEINVFKIKCHSLFKC